MKIEEKCPAYKTQETMETVSWCDCNKCPEGYDCEWNRMARNKKDSAMMAFICFIGIAMIIAVTMLINLVIKLIG